MNHIPRRTKIKTLALTSILALAAGCSSYPDYKGTYKIGEDTVTYSEGAIRGTPKITVTKPNGTRIECVGRGYDVFYMGRNPTFKTCTMIQPERKVRYDNDTIEGNAFMDAFNEKAVEYFRTIAEQKRLRASGDIELLFN